MSTYLFRTDCPQGRVFEDAQLADALKDGWVDSPEKIKAPVETKAPETPSDAEEQTAFDSEEFESPDSHDQPKRRGPKAKADTREQR